MPSFPPILVTERESSVLHRKPLGPGLRGDDKLYYSWESAERECRVGAAEAERVRQRATDFHFPCDERHEIAVALRIAVDEIRCRRRHLIAERQRGEHGFDTAGGTEEVARHGLGRADRHLPRTIAERALDGDAFRKVAKRRRCS